MVDVKYRNPYLDAYREQLAHEQACQPSMIADWRTGGAWGPMGSCQCETGGTYRSLRTHFSYAVPDDAAIDTILRYSPGGIVEVGAGLGYWAWMLHAAGLAVNAYDPQAWHSNDYFSDAEKGWFDVQPGDAFKAADHPGATLLLVWPPYDEPMGTQALRAYKGDTVIYVGEGAGGCTGDDEMHALLGRGYGHRMRCDARWDDDTSCKCDLPSAMYREVEEVSIPQLWGLHDYLHVFKRL